MKTKQAPKVQVVILTPLPEEFEGVRSLLEDGGSFTDVVFKRTYWIGYLRTAKNETLRIALRLSQKGHLSTAEAVQQSMQTFDAALLVLFGTAAGIKKVGMGDVVVATAGYSYESGKIVPGGFMSNPRAIEASPNWIGVANNVALQSDWHPEKGEPQQRLPAVYFGPIISGEKVITDPNHQIAAQFKTHFQDAIALEMEAFAFLHAARNYPKVETLIIRGVSDFMADKEQANLGGSKKRAINHAAAFLYAVLKEASVARPATALWTTALVGVGLIAVSLVGLSASGWGVEPNIEAFRIELTPSEPDEPSEPDDSTISVPKSPSVAEGDKKGILMSDEQLSSGVGATTQDIPQITEPITDAVAEQPSDVNLAPLASLIKFRILVFNSKGEKWRNATFFLNGQPITLNKDFCDVREGDYELLVKANGRTLLEERINISGEGSNQKIYENVD